MGGDRLDAQLEPLAQFLLILITLLVVASITAYILSKLVQRRKQSAHNKLSNSRRTKESGINLLKEGSDLGREPERQSSGRRSKGSRSSFNLASFLNDLAYKLDVSRLFGRKKRRRGKRRKR